MMRCLVVALSCLMAAATSPSQTDAPKDGQKQSIQGKVIETKSGQPIRKVNIEVMGGSGQSYGRHEATTGADGTFTIEDMTPGRYTITPQRAGFAQTGASRSQATFTLQPGQNLTGLVFRMQAAGVISGKIVDADGDPMAGAGVSATIAGAQSPLALRNSSGGGGATNDLGEYRIADLRPGKYVISAQPSQRTPVGQVPDQQGKTKERLLYVTTYFPGTLDNSQAADVDVRSGEEAVANFGVLTSHVYRVSGSVTGAPSGPLTQMFLISKDGGAGMDNPEQLKGDNRFEYQNLLPGTYTAMMIVVKGALSEGRPEIQMVQLSPQIEVDKTDVEGVLLHLDPGGQVHGKFRLDTGEKFDWTQLNVHLLPVVENETGAFGSAVVGMASARANTQPMVGADGAFEMKNVPGGSYQLVIGAQSNDLRDYYTKSMMLGGKDVVDSGFTVNGDVSLDVVVSAKGATIEGNVVDSKGAPAAYSIVAVVPNSEQRARPDSYQQATTDERGHFVARGLNPGGYVVLAFEELQEDMRQPEFLKMYAGKGEKVELEEGARKLVSVKIIPAETDAP
jgi:protocatechuate 3,4-dioxygenase beta subunit